MSRVSFLPQGSLTRYTLMGAVLIGAMIPMAVFAQESGPERPINSTKLPFLREASSGGVVTTIHYTSPGDTGAGADGNGATGGNGSESDNAAQVPPGGLLSQGNNCRFRDISGHQSETAINYLYDKGIAGGRHPCYFEPNAVATRAEVATMVVRAVEAPMPESATPAAFPDTNVKSWSAKHVKAAKNADIVHGYPDGLYRAEKPVNVVESLKITTRGFGSDFKLMSPAALQEIRDIELNQWYVKYVQAGLNEGLIDGNAKYIAPAGEVTRAEIADMIYILMRKHGL